MRWMGDAVTGRKNGKLTLSAKVAGDTSNNTKDDRGPRVEETRGRGSSNKTGDGTRAPADHGPLTGQTEIEKAPGHGGEHGSKARVPAGHGSTEVGTKGRATVESEPTEPEEDGAESDERDVVRTEVHHHLLVASAENPRVGEGRHTGADLDGDTASVIEDTVLETPSVGVPDPVGERAVDEGSPAKDEDHGGNDTATFGDGSDSESSCDGTEHHLVEGVEKSGNERRADRGGAPDLHEAKMSEIADKGIAGGLGEGERVAPKVPLKDDNGEGHHDDPEHGEGRLSASETRVEEGDTGNHHEDESCRDEDEGLVT